MKSMATAKQLIKSDKLLVDIADMSLKSTNSIVVDCSIKSRNSTHSNSQKEKKQNESNYKLGLVQMMDHDVETRLAASKIAVNSFKPITGNALLQSPQPAAVVGMHRTSTTAADSPLHRL